MIHNPQQPHNLAPHPSASAFLWAESTAANQAPSQPTWAMHPGRSRHSATAPLLGQFIELYKGQGKGKGEFGFLH